MDKLMQVVNELKGDLGNTYGVSPPRGRFLFIDEDAGDYVISESRRDNCECLAYICTVEEFNNLVVELSSAEWIKVRNKMSYTIEDLRGKYVEVGTPECRVFLDACEGLGVKWRGGKGAHDYGRSTPFVGILSGGIYESSYILSDWTSPFTPKPAWTIYNNDKPLSDLSDEQVGKLVKNGGAVESSDGKNWYEVEPDWSIKSTYRAKQKSERELFIEKGLAVYESDGVGGNVESLLGAMFDADFKAPKGGE